MNNLSRIFLAVWMAALLAWPAGATIRNVQENYLYSYFVVSSSGAHVTGQTVALKIYRASDGYWYDFNDNTFKTSGWTSKTTNLSENSTDGFYYYTFNPPASETGAEQYLFLVDNTNPSYADHQAELVSYESGAVSSGSALAIADAVWDEALADHATTGSTGKALSGIADATDGDKESGSYTGIEEMIRIHR